MGEYRIGPPLWEEAWDAQKESATLNDPPPSAKFGVSWEEWLSRHPFLTQVAEDIQPH